MASEPISVSSMSYAIHYANKEPSLVGHNCIMTSTREKLGRGVRGLNESLQGTGEGGA